MSKDIVFGIDIGGTSIKCGVFTVDGMLVKKEEMQTRKENSGAYIFDDIAVYIKRTLIEEEIDTEDVAGVGLGVPGAVTGDSVVNRCVNLGWGVIDAAQSLKNSLDNELGSGVCDSWKILAANDANVAALGEYWHGSGRSFKSMMMVTVGTGVGGGLILGGKIISGFNGAAAEIGHMPIADEFTNTCSCGKTGCLELAASATGIARLGKKENAKLVFDAAKAGDDEALAVIEKVSKYLAKSLACVSAVVDPEGFIIGGGVSAAGDFFIDKVKKYYKQMAFHASRNTIIIRAQLGNDAGMHGAAKLVIG